MTYDHSKQFRSTIVRGKALTELDDLLPAYASIISQICPSYKDDFTVQFNKNLSHYLPSAVKKTLDNHRTEIAGKLFGLYYADADNIIHISERGSKLLNDSDQPAFFKDLCAKYQFPSGISTISTVADQISHGIQVRQLSFVLKVLLEVDKLEQNLSKKEIAYYILNSLDVLTRQATPREIIEQISQDRNKKITREISAPNKASSFNYQHINEQLNLLFLANLITYDDGFVILNSKEMNFIEALARQHNLAPAFDFTQYDLSDIEDRKNAEIKWGIFFAQLSDIDETITSTSALALSDIDLPSLPKSSTIDKIALGDDGEEYVYNLEVNRVKSSFPRLVNKIKKQGIIKGLGYDILSVIGQGLKADFPTYIEVKSTKRVTPPLDDFTDTVNLTRNEWVAAEQHKDSFYIYRVYFCQNEIKLFILQNPFQQNEDGNIFSRPLNYRLEFDQASGKFYDE